MSDKNSILKEIDSVLKSTGEVDESTQEILSDVSQATDLERDKFHVASQALIAKAINNLAKTQALLVKTKLLDKDD